MPCHCTLMDSTGTAIYNSFPFDPGLAGAGWGTWEFVNSVALDPLAAGVVFNGTPAFLANPLTASIDALAAGWTRRDVTGVPFADPKAAATLQAAERDLARTQQLVTQGFVSAARLDEARKQFKYPQLQTREAA